MKLCELADSYAGAIEVHESSEIDGAPAWRKYGAQTSDKFFADYREVIKLAPLDPFTIRVYVKEG